MNLQADFYLVVTYNIRGGYNRELSLRTTKQSPPLKGNEIAIKCRLDLPKSLFERPALSATIKIPDEAVPHQEINMEMTDNIAELIEQNLGITMTIGVDDECSDP